MQTHKLNDTHPRPPRAAGNTQMQSLLIIVGVGVVAVGSLHAFGNASKQALTARTHASGARSADVAVAPSVGSRSEAMLGFGTLSKGLDRVRRGWRNLRGLGEEQQLLDVFDAKGRGVAEASPSDEPWGVVGVVRTSQGPFAIGGADDAIGLHASARFGSVESTVGVGDSSYAHLAPVDSESRRVLLSPTEPADLGRTRYPGWAQLQEASLYREYRKMVDPMFDEELKRSGLAERLFRAFGEDEARLDLLRTQRIRGIAPIVTPERVAGIRVKLDDTALDFIADRGGNFSLHMGRADIDTRPDAMMNLAQIRFRTSARSWGEESAAHFDLSANQPRLSADQLATVPPNSALLGPGRPVTELDLARLSGVDLR